MQKTAGAGCTRCFCFYRRRALPRGQRLRRGLGLAAPRAACRPATRPLPKAQWRLKPPQVPAQSRVSPTKYSPGQPRNAKLSGSSSARASPPPAVCPADGLAAKGSGPAWGAEGPARNPPVYSPAGRAHGLPSAGPAPGRLWRGTGPAPLRDASAPAGEPAVRTAA